MIPTKVHHLQNQQTGQRTTLTLADNHVSTETTGGKSRRTDKHFATAAEAAIYAERQEWTLLKKGFVLHHQAAAPGEPLLHCCIGGGYTGSLAFAGTPQGLYVYQHGWFRSVTDHQDFLVQLNTAGQVHATLPLPTVLAWDMHYQPAWSALVLNLDHTIFAYDLNAGVFQPLSEQSRSPASFVAVAAGRTAFVANNELVVLGPDRRTLFRQPLAVQLFQGTLGLAAALARNGELLAIHTTPGEVQVRSAHDGTLQHTLTGTFKLVQQLDFIGNDQLLLLLERPGTGHLRCFDLAQRTEIDFTLSGGEEWPSWTKAYCLNANQTRLAVLRRNWVELYDIGSRQLVRRFRLSHCVKSANLRFVGEALGVRTDYGCFSLYSV